MTAPAAQSTAYYLYGVVARDAGAQPEPPAELVAAGGVAAVARVVDVDALRADAEAGGERLLERVIEHQEVLDRLVAAGLDVVPFRFATLAADGADLEALLSEREPELLAALARLHGRVELGVKLRLDPDALAAAARDERIERLERELAEAGPGAAHLRRKQLDRLRADAAAAERGRCAAAVHQALAAAATAARSNRLPESDDARDVVLNGAYLVERGGEEAFRALAARTAGELGGRAEVTGPWPAYNFAGLDDERR